MSVISFQDLLKEKKGEHKKGSKNNNNTFKDKTKEEIKNLVSAAKAYGLQEIETFEKLTNEYLNGIENMAMFGGHYYKMIRQTSNMMCEEMLTPIVKGEEVPGMPEDLYMVIRKDIYEDLINRIKDTQHPPTNQ